MDENSVSNEVRALIDRMGQFPHEFIGDGSWANFMRQLLKDEGELPFLLTTEEERVLKEAYRRILRGWFSEVVVEKIINPKQGTLFSTTTINTKPPYPTGVVPKCK